MINKKIEDLVVAIVAPSGGVSEERLNLAIERLNKLGVKEVLVRKNITDRFLGYWSGNSKERSDELMNYFRDPKVDIIWAFTGGMSSLELIPFLDFKEIKKNKKIFIGHSDITSLQLALLKYSGMESLQFYMPGTKYWIEEEFRIQKFKELLLSGETFFKIDSENVFKKGFVEGQLVGGCLELVCNAFGTNHEIDTDGKILYLEDTEISPQRLYNYLSMMYNEKKFDNIKGLILSRMPGCGEYRPFLELFLKKIAHLDIPIIIELEAGHCKRKSTIILGGKCIIDTENKKINFGFSEEFRSFFNIKDSKLTLDSNFENKPKRKALNEILSIYKPNNFISAEKIKLLDYEDREVFHISSPVEIGGKIYLFVELKCVGKDVSETLLFEYALDGWILSDVELFGGLSKVQVVNIKETIFIYGYERGKIAVYSGKKINSLSKIKEFSKDVSSISFVDRLNSTGVFFKYKNSIRYLEFDSIDEVTEEDLKEGDKILKFMDDEWGDVVDVLPLSNGKLGVLGYIAKRSKRSKNYFYYPFVFSFNPLNNRVSSLRIILRRGELPDDDSRSSEEYNVLLPGGMIRKDGYSELYATVGASCPYKIRIKDPFEYYENRS